MKRLLGGAFAAALVAVYAGNCVKNVLVLKRVERICPALEVAARERLANSREFFERLFAGDAPLMMQMPDAVVGKTCAALEGELVWYRWNLFRTVRMEETRALRRQMTAAIDRAIPSCPERVARSLEGNATALDLELAASSCQVLKTLRVTLAAPVHDASPWAVADQLERLTPGRSAPTRLHAGDDAGEPAAR